MVFFRTVGKKANVVPIHKKKVKIFSKTLDELAFFQFLLKFMKESFLKSFLVIFININFLQKAKLIFSLVIHDFKVIVYCQRNKFGF